MHSTIESISNFIAHSNGIGVLLDVAIQSCAVLALAGTTCFLLRRASAATRHWIWLLAVLSLPLLPFTSALKPSWETPLWSVSASFDSGNYISFAVELAPATPQSDLFGESQTAALPPSAPFGNEIPPGTPLVDARLHVNWFIVAFGIWGAGTLLVLVSILAGRICLERVARRSKPFHECQSLLDDLRQELGLRREIKLLRAADDIIPLTWGWLAPVVLLPAEADEWPDERRRVVLLHELAHVKRQDGLTSFLTRLVCALYWFNPLVWIAARQMRAERERAADDLVLNGGCKASDYAAHLVDIARSFRRVPQTAGIAMARASGLETRVAAIVDGARIRQLRPIMVWIFAIVGCMVIFCMGGLSAESNRASNNDSALSQRQIEQLKAFAAAKEKQAQALARAEGQEIGPAYQQLFDAAIRGDVGSVTNLYESFKKRHGQYARSTRDQRLRQASFWSPVLEVCLAYDHIANCNPRYTAIAVRDTVNAIPRGSIYFGGTDPGRGLPTAFSKSHIDADPFYTLTQNALADRTYLDYLRMTYGADSILPNRIYTPSPEDMETCFQEYTADAERRLDLGRLKPGEVVTRDNTTGRVQISGQVAVMEINARLAKIIFDNNPGHEFYVEESFPLDWMYPHLEPNGLVMKLNREPLASLSGDVLRRDHEYWRQLVGTMVGDWLDEETPVQTIVEFVDRIFVRKDLSGFEGDPEFVRDNYAPKMFSKWRGSIAGLYAWRLGIASRDAPQSEYSPQTEAEREHLLSEAEFALRQAFVLCPYSLEAVFRYVHLLTNQGRTADALLVAETALLLNSENEAMQAVVEQLRGSQAHRNISVLEFRLVEDTPSPLTEPMTRVARDPQGNPALRTTLHVRKSALLSAADVRLASVTNDALGNPVIHLQLTDAGRQQFARVTRENIDRRLAIIIDGQLHSAPVIRSEIAGGTAQISGNFTRSEAEELADRINSAASR